MNIKFYLRKIHSLRKNVLVVVGVVIISAAGIYYLMSMNVDRQAPIIKSAPTISTTPLNSQTPSVTTNQTPTKSTYKTNSGSGDAPQIITSTPKVVNITNQNPTTNSNQTAASPTHSAAPTPGPPTGDPSEPQFTSSGNSCPSGWTVTYNKPGSLKYEVGSAENGNSVRLQITKIEGNIIVTDQLISGSGSVSITDTGNYTINVSAGPNNACPNRTLWVYYN